MNKRIETFGFGVMVISSITVAGLFVKREVFPYRSPPTIRVDAGPPTRVDEWEAVAGSGVIIGSSNAPVKIVEFADLECPYCRRFHDTFAALQSTFGDRVALVFVHFPLSNHRFARPAARGAECAALEGKFGDYVAAVFAKQDSLGLRPRSAYARDAAVKDLAAFERCVELTTPLTRVEAGVKVGERLQVNATPTILVNGWRFSGVPQEEELRRLISDLLTGKPGPTDSAVRTP
jgi:protein-disulfide isomerase